MITKEKRQKVSCPHCGYEMQIYYDEKSYASGVWVKCKGRGCKKEFEIKLNVR